MSGARGWLEGMVAPRPATPSQYSTSSRPSSPMVQRVPSQDAMERSNHNNSGHGKSAAQIIKELRASNAKLSAKTADMEAEFMNQMNEATMQFQTNQKKLEESLKAKEQQISTMESRRVSAENRIRERDSEVSKLKEEVTFQRHTIADLKNQLYQLQHEIEDAEYDKRDEVEKWSSEKLEMQREMDTLRRQIQDLKEEKASSEVLQNWKQLEETQENLEECRKRLHDTQSQLAVLENENKKAEKDHKAELAILKAKFSEARSEWSIKESDYTQTIMSLQSESGENDLQTRLEQTEKQLEAVNDEKNELSGELFKVKAAAEAQDKYRQDEVEDLRVLHDAQRDELSTLKEDVDSMGRELAEKDEALREKSNEVENLTVQVKKLTTEAQMAGKTSGEKLNKDISDLVDQLEKLKEQSRREKEEVHIARQQHAAALEESERRENQLKNEVDRMEQEIELLRRSRDDAERRSQTNLQNQRNEDETRSAQRLRDVVAKAAKERADLEAEFEARMRKMTEDFERKQETKSKAMESQIKEGCEAKQDLIALKIEYEEIQKRFSELQFGNREKVNELEAMYQRLKESERSAESLRTSTADALQSKVKALESKKASADKAKKQLREAQIALVAIDDEKKRLVEKHDERISVLEKEKLDLQMRLDSLLSQRDTDLTKTREEVKSDYESKLSRLVAENEALLREMDSVRSRVLGKTDNENELVNELERSKDAERKLAASLAVMRTEKEAIEVKLKEKLEDRDTTISALVKSSVSQEQKVSSMKTELQELRIKLESGSSENSSRELPAVRDARNADYVEELENLKRALEGHKDVEQRLNRDLEQSQMRLAVAEEEARKLRELTLHASRSSPSSSEREEFREKLQERDAAIANLVKQSMSQEDHVAKLMDEIVILKRARDESTHVVGGWEELKRLQKESEIFAGQIIEQDEEIEELHQDIADRDDKIESLEREIHALRRKGSARDRGEVADLKAQIDELQEANATQRMEVRDLRKQLRDVKATADESMDLRAELEQANHSLSELRTKMDRITRDEANLRRDRDLAIAEKDMAEQRLSQQLESVRRLRNAAVDSLEEKLQQKKEEVETMEEDLSRRNDKISSLEAEIEKLEKKVEVQTSVAEDSQEALKELRNVLETERSSTSVTPETDTEKDKLLEEIAELKRGMESTTSDSVLVEDLRLKLDEADRIREASEKSLVDTYERKLSLLRLNKDVSLDQLRKELADAKAKNADDSEELKAKLKVLEMESKDLKDEYDAKLQLKNTKIHALEQTLGAQEQLVDNMRSEMDHLQSGMERSSLSRRAEIEEMQQEMMDTASKSQRLEREITTLKMALEESRLEHKSEASKLKEIIASLERTPLKRAIEEDQNDRLNEVKERLENLKWRNTSLQEENLKLRGRLEKAEGELKVSRNDKYRASALEDEISELRDKVEELEYERQLLNSTPPSPRRIPKPPNNEDRRLARSNNKRVKSPSPSRKPGAASPRRSQASPGRLRFSLRRRSNSKDPIIRDQEDVSGGSRQMF